jgi:hypothetical protein
MPRFNLDILKDLKPDREENYHAKFVVTVDGTVYKDIPCKIYLPERKDEEPYMVFIPSKADGHEIVRADKISLKAEILGFDKDNRTIIEAPEIYIAGSSTKGWDDDLTETIVPGLPQDLHIIKYLKNRGAGLKKTHITFWISSNVFLTPFLSCTTSYDGTVEYKRVNVPQYRITENIKLEFDKHFDSKRTKNGDLIQRDYSVACAEIDIPAQNAEKIKTDLLPYVNDFLLIASFVSRISTGCLGWTAYDDNSTTTFYRGYYTFPQNEHSVKEIDNGIIDIKYFNNFMEVCYHNFLRIEDKLPLRSAIHSMVSHPSQTVETSFLKKFAGLESIILGFRRRENLEFILSKDDWPKLRNYLKKCIKNSQKPKIKSEQRGAIYRKLDELNRRSLNEVFKIFCNKYKLFLDDLWPLFGDGKTIMTLSRIRNRLIHGDPFPGDLLIPLAMAEKNLEYIIERIIIKILGWDIGKTKITPQYLKKHFHAVKKLSEMQEKLSQYLKS